MPSRKGKWQPFDALEGYKDKLRDIEYEVTEVDRPVISDDQIEVINNILLNYNGEAIILKYYDKKHLFEISCKIKKIDNYNRIIVINVNNIKIKFEDIIEIIL